MKSNCVLVKMVFIVASEENKIAETFRNTLKNDQNSSVKKGRIFSYTFSVYLHHFDIIRNAI